MTYIGASPPCVRLLLPVFLFGLCALLPIQAPADIYKWVDAGGKVNYTQTPPPLGIASEIIEEADTADTPPETPASTLLEQAEKAEKEREDKAAMGKKEMETEEARRVNCKAASGNLAALQMGGNRRYVTADGEYLRLTGEQRQQRIDEARQQIEKYCSG